MTKEFHQVTWDAQLQDDWRRLLELAVGEDLGRQGDWTTNALVPAEAVGRAAVVVRQAGVVAGLPAVPLALERFDPRLRWSPEAEDGRVVESGRRLGAVEGPARGMLAAERRVAQPAGAIVGHRHPDAKIRRCGRRHQGPHLRYSQNHPRLAPPGKIRRPLWRRLEPSQRLVRGRAHQGQPPGAVRRARRRASPPLRPARPSSGPAASSKSTRPTRP